MDFDIYKLVNRYKLTDTERQILEYLLRDIEGMLDKNVREVAKDNYASPATVIKLAKKMNYRGYIDMVYQLYHNRGTAGAGGTSSDLPQNLFSRVRKEDVEQATKMLLGFKERRLFLCGSGFARPIAEYLSLKLQINDYNAAFSDMFAVYESSQATKGLLIMVSCSGDTGNIISIAEKAKENQMTLILLSSQKKGKLASLSDLTLVIGNENPLNDQNKYANYFYPGVILFFESLLAKLNEAKGEQSPEGIG